MRTKDTQPSDTPGAPAVRPILVGGDIGAYATARAFHEAYGVSSVVLAGVRVGSVAHSAIVDLRIHAGLSNADTLAEAVLEVMAEQPDTAHLVLGSADWLVTAIVAVRDRLEDAGAVVPYPGAHLLEQVADKAVLMARAGEAGMPHPRTVQGVPAEEEPPGGDVDFPVVVKPASTAAAQDVDYPGKAKVHMVADAGQLRALWHTMATAGVSVPMLVQEYIDGPDSAMAAVNVFLDPGGRVRLAQFGQVLLEEHAPSAVGNSVAQLTGDPVGAQARAVTQVVDLLQAIGWRGFANADLKRSPDGHYRLLEINPRVGRSGYAVTASGYNVAAMYGQAFLDLGPGRDEREGPVRQMSPQSGGVEPIPVATAQHLFSVVPWPVLRRYLPAPWRGKVNRIRRSGAVTNPLYYRVERHPRRLLYVAMAMANYARKLARHHPGR